LQCSGLGLTLANTLVETSSARLEPVPDTAGTFHHAFYPSGGRLMRHTVLTADDERNILMVTEMVLEEVVYLGMNDKQSGRLW
jgi:hypothetical protein